MSEANILNPIGPLGFPVLSSPVFESGLVKFSVYDNASSGKVSISLVQDASAPSGAGQKMAVTTASGAPAPSPGLGGFFYNLPANASVLQLDNFIPGDVALVTLVANIPVGYTLNQTGNVGTGTWLTSQAGTGTWQVYQVRITGITAFATPAFLFFYLTVGAAPVTWYVAEIRTFDASQALSLTTPDYGYGEGLPEMRTSFQAQSGKAYSRRQMGRGRVYDLAWNKRDKVTMHALRQWERQYENDFFTLVDWERSRYFSGRFDAPLQFSPAGNENWNIRGRFIELPGAATYMVPGYWTRDAMFLEERDGFGADLVKLTGVWTFLAGVFHGGGRYHSNATNATAEWIYFGYGFRCWASKQNNAGIMEVSATRIRDGTAALAATNVDLYAAGAPDQAAVVVLTKSDLALDWYRVKLRVTGTKNISSTDFYCFADAIEVMQ